MVESWWNGNWGSLSCERVRLHRYGHVWAVEHETPHGHDGYRCDSEAQARERVAALTAEGDWRRVDAAASGDQD